jgi:4-diphosphocytidyl-2-C-methyl-D-erythritol kinase
MTEGQGWSAWPAPAKINLFLRILGRRPDGYHRLQAVFQLLEWGDTVSLRVRSDGAITRVGGSDYGVAAADDLVVRAANLLQNYSKSGKGVDISVEKRIPAGGGFGGGSSDAATVLVVLNQLWGAGLDEDALAGLGLQLGADVPVFVRGGNAWAEGVGDDLTPIVLPEAWFLLVDTGVSVPTRELFQTPELTRDAAPATIVDFVSGAALGNAFEPVLRRLDARVDRVFDALSQHGKACLTGTGGGCFLRFDTQAAAESAQSRLPAGLRSWVAAGAVESSLCRALRGAGTTKNVM